VDFPPPLNATQKAVLDQEMVTALRDADALVQVVRGFPDLAGAAPTAVDDVAAFSTELALADLAQVEKKVERMKKEKGNERELALFVRLQQILEEGKPLRTAGLGADEQTQLAGFAFLSLRPLLVVLNVPEGDVAKPYRTTSRRPRRTAGAEALVLSARSRPRASSMPPTVKVPRGPGPVGKRAIRFIRASYALLDLISFLTAGEDECRAWPIRRGTAARKAAGRIHSDIERGFIRAEVMAFDDFMRLGSEAKCREAGKLRLEGKDYVVQDGDIVQPVRGVSGRIRLRPS
jgi:ribosome-binding ATPase YchF (GTP1/OBG family)